MHHYEIDKKPSESAKHHRLFDAAKHIFSKILPHYGYAVREKQLELSEHILDVICRKGITLAESEVGTGKTHAYLVAAALAKRGRLNDSWFQAKRWSDSADMPVVISTSSIALQKAIVKDYIPQLSQILMKHGIIRDPLTAVIRKGREHYICEKRLTAYYNAADFATKMLLKPFNGSHKPFDLSDADGLTPYMKKRICVADRCRDRCKYFRQCRYASYMRKANDHKVDFQITNHNYFLADALHRADGRNPLLPNFQLVIFDESHKLLQAAQSMYGLEFTDKELPALAQEIHAFTVGKSKKGVNVDRLAKKLEEQSAKMFRYINDNIPASESDEEAERLTAVFDGMTDRYMGNIIDTAGKLAAAIGDSRVSKTYEARQSKTIWKLTQVGEKMGKLRKHGGLIHWLEKQIDGRTKTDALCAIPKNLNAQLCKDLWNKGIPMILTSGTLSASGDFTRIKQTLGLGRVSEHKLFSVSMPSPFDYKSNTLLYFSENVPFPNNKDRRYITAVADEIERLVIASHGHAAVLFTSYNTMGQVHALLRNRNLPFPLFRLERGGTHAIEQFKCSGNGILFASGALWEGIDIPGDALSLLIIVRLPFVVPDPIGDYELSLCGGDIGLYKQSVVKPDMQVRLKQGDGRLMRVESDTGVVAIFDPRYRQWVLEALPERRVTSDVEEVRRFFKEKKPDEYYKK